MDIEEKQAIKMMKFYQEEYRKQIKTLKENGEPEGYGTIIDTMKGRICNIQLVLNLIEKQEAELEKKDKVINEYEKECRMFKAFCRRVRRDDKHNVDEFNQGQEHKCNQFLNLLSGEKNWDFEGKYFDETEKEIEKAENVGE